MIIFYVESRYEAFNVVAIIYDKLLIRKLFLYLLLFYLSYRFPLFNRLDVGPTQGL